MFEIGNLFLGGRVMTKIHTRQKSFCASYFTANRTSGQMIFFVTTSGRSFVIIIVSY